MKWIFFLGCLFGFASCAPDPKLLEGNWKAAAFYQNGQSKTMPLDSVEMVFYPDQIYTFRSIGLYRERGVFRTSSRYLFLRDSTGNPLQERALKILFLSNDTLKLKMQHEESEQVLFLVKKPRLESINE